MEVKGKVHEIGPIQQVSETFKKRDLILEVADNPTYPEFIRFESLQDKTALFDALRVGNDVTVHFNLRGRPWTDKTGKTSYFNSLVVWRIEGGTLTATTPDPVEANQYTTDIDESEDQPF